MNPSPPPVLLFTGGLGPGGTELTVFRTALGLAGRGRFAPRVVVLGSAGEMGEELRGAGVPVDEAGVRGRLYGPAGFRGLSRVRRIVRDSAARLLHTFLFDADVLGTLAGRLERLPVITTRRAIKRGKSAQLLAYRLTHRWADRIAANSEEVRRFTLDVERAPPSKVLVLSNGIDTEPLAGGDRVGFRERLAIPADAPVVGTLGTVKAVKGQDVLLEAVLPLLRRRPNLQVLVVGAADGSFAGALRHRSEEAGVGDRFRLLGSRSDVADVLAGLDVFVLPSRSEGMSNALLEAMAAGVPSVATRVGGNAEALAGGAAGRLVPPEDAVALGAAVAGLLDDAQERDRLARAARQRAKTEYDLAIMLERTERLYGEVLAERSRP